MFGFFVAFASFAKSLTKLTIVSIMNWWLYVIPLVDN